MTLLDNNGALIWSDIRCTVPAYRGPVPAMEQSAVSLDLLNAEYSSSVADIFNER